MMRALLCLVTCASAIHVSRCPTPKLSAAVGPLPVGLGGAYPALRGPVSEGFGRGSRKLGIPTANLPCSLFQEQLAELPCGVYVGWAAVRGGVHKCVCNIGFSPTFAGAENPEKIVEAHIMESFNADFYGEEMRLLLLGFIRDERKFSGIDELLATIKADIATATAELDVTPLAEARAAPFLSQATAKGDDAAAYDLIDPAELLQPSDKSPPSTDSSGGGASTLDGPPPPPGFEWGLTL